MEGKWFIYKATKSECVEIANLAITMWNTHTIEELVKEFYDILNNKESAIFIACVEDNKIGFAQCGLRHDYVEGTKSSPVGYLEGIFVKEEYRNKGYAKALLDMCEKWAKAQGCLEFASDCELENVTSLKFHLRMGFEETNRLFVLKEVVLRGKS